MHTHPHQSVPGTTVHNFTRITESTALGAGVFWAAEDAEGVQFDISYQAAAQVLMEVDRPVDSLSLLLDSVISRVKGNADIPNVLPGILMPYGIVSMALTSTAVHVEDALLCAVNQLLCGDSKVWLVHAQGHTGDDPIGGEDLKPDLYRKQLSPGHPSVTLPYLLLEKRMIPIIQTPGQIIVTAPSQAGAHVTVSSGFSVAESSNTLLVMKSSLKDHLRSVYDLSLIHI